MSKNGGFNAPKKEGFKEKVVEPTKEAAVAAGEKIQEVAEKVADKLTPSKSPSPKPVVVPAAAMVEDPVVAAPAKKKQGFLKRSTAMFGLFGSNEEEPAPVVQPAHPVGGAGAFAEDEEYTATPVGTHPVGTHPVETTPFAKASPFVPAKEEPLVMAPGFMHPANKDPVDFPPAVSEPLEPTPLAAGAFEPARKSPVFFAAAMDPEPAAAPTLLPPAMAEPRNRSPVHPPQYFAPLSVSGDPKPNPTTFVPAAQPTSSKAPLAGAAAAGSVLSGGPVAPGGPMGAGGPVFAQKTDAPAKRVSFEENPTVLVAGAGNAPLAREPVVVEKKRSSFGSLFSKKPKKEETVVAAVPTAGGPVYVDPAGPSQNIQEALGDSRSEKIANRTPTGYATEKQDSNVVPVVAAAGGAAAVGGAAVGIIAARDRSDDHVVIREDTRAPNAPVVMTPGARETPILPAPVTAANAGSAIQPAPTTEAVVAPAVVPMQEVPLVSLPEAPVVRAGVLEQRRRFFTFAYTPKHARLLANGHFQVSSVEGFVGRRDLPIIAGTTVVAIDKPSDVKHGWMFAMSGTTHRRFVFSAANQLERDAWIAAINAAKPYEAVVEEAAIAVEHANEAVAEVVKAEAAQPAEPIRPVEPVRPLDPVYPAAPVGGVQPARL